MARVVAPVQHEFVMDQITVQGVVRPDGSLELPPLPGLPSGPVEITVRPLAASGPAKENWWEYLQRARAELEAEGHEFRTGEEIDAYIEELRSGDERIEQINRTVNSRDDVR
jgi:hypothetical protein